mmetsp:Transcript_14135/g.30163  ORF Transcript_14135/g.30163 Transcript_14135/m.30163 type:complete len:223 (+) Transcript_14135:1187-1855(+)
MPVRPQQILVRNDHRPQLPVPRRSVGAFRIDQRKFDIIIDPLFHLRKLSNALAHARSQRAFLFGRRRLSQHGRRDGHVKDAIEHGVQRIVAGIIDHRPGVKGRFVLASLPVHDLDVRRGVALGKRNVERLGDDNRGQSAQLIPPLVLHRRQALQPIRQVEQLRRQGDVTSRLPAALHLQLQLARAVPPEQIPHRDLRPSHEIVGVGLVLVPHLGVYCLIHVV